MAIQETITALKDLVNTFELEYAKYVEKDVNSAGSKARKALQGVKKAAGALRKEILAEQKAKKNAAKSE